MTKIWYSNNRGDFMKKYMKIIIPILIILVIVLGILWYMDKNKLEPGFANLQSDNWPELINNDEEISKVTKSYIYAVYGEDKKVNIESLEVYHPEEEQSYIQINYGTDIYIANQIDNTVFIFKSDLMDGNIDTTIDYSNEYTHVEQPNEAVYEKANKVISAVEQIYKDYNFTKYEASQYPTNADENVSNLYVRRDDGFAQFAIGYLNKNETQSMNLVILLQNENIIGIAIQINS